MKRLFATVALASLLALTLSACPAGPAADPFMDLARPAAVSGGVNLADVPVPPTFVLTRQSEGDYQSAAGRSARRCYVGNTAAGDVAEFYRQSMPDCGWSALREIPGPQRTIMVFQKENETCQVTVTDQQFAAEVDIQVFANLAGLPPQPVMGLDG